MAAGTSRAASDACRSAIPDCGRSSAVDLKTCVMHPPHGIQAYLGLSHWCKHCMWPHASACPPGEASGREQSAVPVGQAHPDTVLAPVAPEAIVAGPVCPGEHAHAALLTVLPLAIIPVAWPQQSRECVIAAAFAGAELVACNSHAVALYW
jgi:hypothetical protein